MKGNEQRNSLIRLANEFQAIADEIGHKFGDSDALLVFKGVIIGIRRAAIEIVDCPCESPEPQNNMGKLRDAVRKARGCEAPSEHKGFA